MRPSFMRRTATLPDRLHERPPSVRLVAAERLGHIRRPDGLARAALLQQREHGGLHLLRGRVLRHRSCLSAASWAPTRTGAAT